MLISCLFIKLVVPIVVLMIVVVYTKNNSLIVIMASVIMANVTITASVTYGKCNLCQLLLMANVLWQA